MMLKNITNQAATFSFGYTHVMEMGKPLVTEWNILETKEQRECYAKHFTEADLKGLRTVARQYANSTRCAIKLKDIDNIFAEQYILTQGLRHGDLDETECCKDCSYDEILKFNCKVISQVAHKSMDCRRLEQPMQFQHDHINSTEALMKCVNHQSYYGRGIRV